MVFSKAFREGCDVFCRTIPLLRPLARGWNGPWIRQCQDTMLGRLSHLSFMTKNVRKDVTVTCSNLLIKTDSADGYTA